MMIMASGTVCRIERKRAIDVMLMSIGGNDVGFSALAAYSLTENMGDLAPIAGLIGSSNRCAKAKSRSSCAGTPMIAPVP